MIVQRRLAGKPSMTPLEIIRRAQDGTLIDEDGEVVTLELFSGLSNTELQEFANHLPCRIPPEIAELLGACRGFYGTVEQVEFTGRDLMFEFEAAFPYGLPIAADGPRGSLPRAMSPLRGPHPLGLRARARRKLPDNRPAPGETGRWLLLGPLRPKDPDPTLRHACYVRL